jgi:acyl carrier protein
VTVGEADPFEPELLAQIAGLLQEVTGEDAEWSARIGPATRLDGDLLLDSVELVALSVALERRYGGPVDLAGFVADLDIDQIIALTIADVAAFVASRRGLAAGHAASIHAASISDGASDGIPGGAGDRIGSR